MLSAFYSQQFLLGLLLLGSFESEPVAGPSCLSIDAAKRLAKSEESRLEFNWNLDELIGEEKESNVFQFNTTLYVFNKTSQNFDECGCGLLRLNDRTQDTSRPFQSRLVMHALASRKVLLHTPIWMGMLIEIVGSESIRITALCRMNDLKTYLINANPNDTSLIYIAIISRIQRLKMMHESVMSASRKRNLAKVKSSCKRKRASGLSNSRMESYATTSEDSRECISIANKPIMGDSESTATEDSSVDMGLFSVRRRSLSKCYKTEHKRVKDERDNRARTSPLDPSTSETGEESESAEVTVKNNLVLSNNVTLLAGLVTCGGKSELANVQNEQAKPGKSVAGAVWRSFAAIKKATAEKSMNLVRQALRLASRAAK